MTRRPNILALDLSIAATGVATPDGRTYTIRPTSKRDHRLCELRDAIRTELRGPRGRIDMAVLENLIPGQKKGSIIPLAMVHGTIRALLIDQAVPYALVNPGTLKLYATGHGNADKTAMAAVALERAGATFTDGQGRPDDNQCDAWWLRAMALDVYGHPPIALPDAQRGRLAIVTWPHLTTQTGDTAHARS